VRYLKDKVVLWVVSIALILPLFPIHAQAASDRVVRVGFPIQGNISYIDENGDYAGYLVDYLEQLTLFTDWEIEYVQAEGDLNTQISTLLDQLESGEIDMMGTMNRNESLEERFLYPNYGYGSTFTVVAVRDDSSYIYEDFSNWNGITIASYPGLDSRMELFEQYAQVNGFTYEVVNYDSFDEVINAVRTGEVDAALQVDISMLDELRSIGRFSPTPYYFALSPTRQDLLPELNSALEIMTLSNENLQQELYQRYFMNTDYFRASQEELDYIQSLGTLRVLFFEGNAPFQYIKDGELTGFSVEYFNDFAESVGLQYEAVLEDDAEEASQLIKDNQVDLIACIATDSALSYEQGIRLSLPYFHSYASRTCSTGHDHTDGEVLEFDMNTEKMLKNLQSDQDTCSWIDEYSLNYYLRKKAVYDDIVTDWADTEEFSYAVAVVNTLPNTDMMVSLLNQFSSSISSKDTQARLSTYLSDEIDYTPAEWILANRGLITIALLILFFFVIVLIFFNYHKKMAYNALVNENKLLQLSSYDELTGAYNRTYFCKLMDEKIKNHQSWALIALNIHNFKYINDTYGTAKADQLLCKIKDILHSDLKDGELLCRPIADSFYLAISEYRSEDIIGRINRLEPSLKEMADDLLDGYRLSIYWGAISSATSPDLSNVQANLNCVIVALAHAKQSGDSNICIYNDSVHQQEQLRQYVEANKYRALEDGEYQVYLQPKMDLRTGNIDSAEALVRWQTRDRGLLFPDQFIPLFEQSEFCKHLDLYMLEKSCQLLREWMDAGKSPISISINQTKSLFVSNDYLDKLLEITSRYQIPPQYIVLEILEGLAFENIAELNNTISRLHQAGFRVSMDDFGSGYSSLNTLGKLHIDQIKLDRMFLMDLRDDQRSSQKDVMQLIFALAQKLGVETVTEGVETQEDEALIRSMGCDYGQGYYYSKPIPAQDFYNTFLKG
jgi:diguanylate cyclase (GGDEF)-like protein